MDPSAQRQLAHAHAVRARGAAMPPDGLPAPEVLDSWVRCMQAGLDPTRPLQVPVLEAADLQQRRERSEVARRLARAELETLSQQIAGSNFLLAFADREGVILDLYADNRFSMSDDGAAIVAGSCWGEPLCGTNGLGTALAAGRSVAVTGLEHFYLSLGDISCTATPVRDASGDIVGVLDASSYFDSRQRHTQALVQMAATHIENGLLQHQMRGHWLLALHPRPEFLGTLSAGLLAFDGGGTLQALNARARQLLQGLDAGTGTAFEALFGEAFDLVLARLQRQGPQRLRDRLGSALVAQLLGAPARQAPRRAAVAAAAPAAPAAAPAPPTAPTATGPVHDDPAVVAAYRLAEAAVRLHVPVLIQGETGSGKEVLARHLHRRSGRAGAFVAVNCGALPAELIEAELFGYVGGAFTGARREGSAGLDRRGRRRHAAARRSGRAAAAAAGVAAALPGRPGRAAGRRHHAPAGRRAAAGGHARRPGDRGRGPALPQRPAVPAEHGARGPAAAARAAGLPRRGAGDAGSAGPGSAHRRRPPSRGWRCTAGPATSANCVRC